MIGAYMIFGIIIIVGFVFLVIFFFRALLGKSQSAFDEDELSFKQGNVADHLKPHQLNTSSLYEEAIPSIEEVPEPAKIIHDIPHEMDEYGYGPKNPIPTKSLSGTTEYLDNLITLEGDHIDYKFLGKKEIPDVPTPIDEYAIMHRGREIAILYFNAHTMINSTRPPKGFRFY
jgi:hypothetical protein